ncbi:MAG: hypothetical protein ACR2RF_24880 [Geminicoccaceae bacterium]
MTEYPWGCKTAEDAEYITARLNFFAGRSIPTENIPESGFWEMVAIIKVARDLQQLPATRKTFDEFLTKLGIEP